MRFQTHCAPATEFVGWACCSCAGLNWCKPGSYSAASGQLTSAHQESQHCLTVIPWGLRQTNAAFSLCLCQLCEKGLWGTERRSDVDQVIAGSSTCIACPAGTFSNKTGVCSVRWSCPRPFMHCVFGLLWRQWDGAVFGQENCTDMEAGASVHLNLMKTLQCCWLGVRRLAFGLRNLHHRDIFRHDRRGFGFSLHFVMNLWRHYLGLDNWYQIEINSNLTFINLSTLYFASNHQNWLSTYCFAALGRCLKWTCFIRNKHLI